MLCWQFWLHDGRQRWRAFDPEFCPNSAQMNSAATSKWKRPETKENMLFLVLVALSSCSIITATDHIGFTQSLKTSSHHVAAVSKQQERMEENIWKEPAAARWAVFKPKCSHMNPHDTLKRKCARQPKTFNKKQKQKNPQWAERLWMWSQDVVLRSYCSF